MQILSIKYSNIDDQILTHNKNGSCQSAKNLKKQGKKFKKKCPQKIKVIEKLT